MMQQENETSTEDRNAPHRGILALQARYYAERIIGYEVTQIKMAADSPFSEEKMRAAYAVSEEAGRQLCRDHEEAIGLFDGILFKLNGLSDDRKATAAWRVLKSDMNEVWERIGRLQAYGVDTQPLAEIARHFDAWVESERENPAKLPPAPTPAFMERVRGSVSRMWSMGR